MKKLLIWNTALKSSNLERMGEWPNTSPDSSDSNASCIRK